MNLLDRFFQRLPVRSAGADEHLHLLNEAERRQIRRSQRAVMAAAALLSVLGFLAYYLPIYRHPRWFPASQAMMPLLGMPFKLAWGELLWCVALTTVELFLLTLLNIAGVHEIAVATGFVTRTNKHQNGDAVLQLGLEKKTTEVSRYGIDPFQGMNRWLLLLFNLVLRLKGFLGNQAIRYLTRLLLGRYAVRTLLDFSGMPLYMAINAYSVYAVMRDARVVIMGQTVITLLIQRLPQWELSVREKELLYDTLQYIAVSKRDFHRNHFVLTKMLLETFHISVKQHHLLSADYLEKLACAPRRIAALCQLVILLGFILDGQISWRERTKLTRLNAMKIVPDSYPALRQYARAFLKGKGIDGWSEVYLQRLNHQERPMNL